MVVPPLRKWGPWALLAGLLSGCLSLPEPPARDLAAREAEEGLRTTWIHDARGHLLSASEPFGNFSLQSSKGGYFSTGFPAHRSQIESTTTGALLVSVTNGAFGAEEWVLRSRDHGRTWTHVGPYLPFLTMGKLAPIYTSTLLADKATGVVFKFSQELYACNSFTFTDDDGTNWSPPLPACGLPTGAVNDGPVFTVSKPRGSIPVVGYENVLVYCASRAYTYLGAWCSSSFTGGATWTPAVPGFPPAVSDSPISVGQCWAISASMASDSEGRIYRASNGCDVPTLFRSEDDGFTWTQHAPAADLGVLNYHVALALDGSDVLHMVWIEEAGGGVWLSSSGDHGDHWTPPANVTLPGLTGVASVGAVAGSAGRLAIAYTATNHSMGADAREARWAGYVAMLPDASAENPVIVTSRINDPEKDPFHLGRCDAAYLCHTRYDSNDDIAAEAQVDMALDPDGRPWALFTHYREGELALAGTFLGGPRLTGPAGALPPLEEVMQAPPSG